VEASVKAYLDSINKLINMLAHVNNNSKENSH
jgi:hypothetical protein